MENRRDFLKKAACFTGACFCGFTPLIGQASTGSIAPNPNEALMQDWISNLLSSMAEQTDPTVHRTILKACAKSHYEQLKMDELLQPYVGKLDEFNRFLESEWGWKIQYQPEKGILTADENKSACVCPLVNKVKGVRSSILCYCSEGFAESMFSKVVGHPVRANVLQSIHRGATSCVYQIELH